MVLERVVTGLGRDVPGWAKGLTMEEWVWDPGGLFTRVGLLGNRLQEVVGAVARPGMAEVMPRTTWLPHFPAPGVERSTGSWRRASHVRVRVRVRSGSGMRSAQRSPNTDININKCPERDKRNHKISPKIAIDG